MVGEVVKGTDTKSVSTFKRTRLKVLTLTLIEPALLAPPQVL